MRKVEQFPQIDPVALLGLGPTAAYLAMDALIGVRAAIAGAVVVGVIAWVVQRRLRPNIRVVRWLGMLGAAFMVGFGIAGLVAGDGKLFWASDFVDNFVIGGLFLLSAIVGRPIISPVLRELFPMIAERVPADHRVWMKITLVWGVKVVISGLLRMWLLDQVDANTYAWLRLPIGWGLNVVLFAWTFYVIDRTMKEVAIERGRSKSDKAGSSDEVGEVVSQSELSKR